MDASNISEKSKNIENDQEKESNDWIINTVRCPTLKFNCNAISHSSSVILPAEKLHMTFKTIQAETKLLSTLLIAHGFHELIEDTKDFNLLWTGSHVKPLVFRNLLSHQRVNHFPRSYELTRKDRLYKNIEQMQHDRGLKHFDFVPQTFILPTEINELIASHYRHRGAWIVKPIASSRGRGIYIVNSIEDMPLQETVIVAKYIENPLLINGCKCDLRLYVLVTSYNPLIIYLYEEGLVRFATVKYDLKGKNLWNPCMHLCNYSINKHHSNYIKSSDPDADDIGHKWSLSALLKHLRSENCDTGLLMQRIEDMIIKAILATASSIVSACKLFVPYQENCFELYGFDVLIDSELKPWLLEVNLSPSLGCDSPLDTRLKSALLLDLLTLVGIPAVDPVTRPKCTKNVEFSSTRQILSVDGLEYVKKSTRKGSNNLYSSSLEETKLVRFVRDQFDRKRGFVRIFPTAETWKKYSKYLDPVNGIPTSGTTQYHNQIINQNYNKMIHLHLFANIFTMKTSTSSRNGVFPLVSKSFDRLKRYEKSLNNSYQRELETELLQNENFQSLSFNDDENFVNYSCKQKVTSYLQRGSILNRYQIQSMFSVFLHKILYRLKDAALPNDKFIPKEIQCDIILQFLHTISQTLSMPLQFKKPSEHLKGNDKVAITAKYLSDFLFFYVQEINRVSPSENENFIPECDFNSFLKAASENDIEDILTMSLRLQNSETRPSKSLRLSKLSLFEIFKRVENCVLSKVTD